MNDFRQALELVSDSLRGLRDSGRDLRASREALERVQAIATSVPAPAVAATPPAREMSGPAASPRPGVTSLSARPAPVVTPTFPAVQAAPAIVVPEGGTRAERLAALRGPVLACAHCAHLAKSRTQVVFGVGNPEAELMFVGEAPGEDEDEQGEPFVGKAGQLLTKIIETMGLRRDDVYIANVLKCRPDMPPGMPGNRKPKPAEMETCKPYLLQQIEIIRPRVMVALGATAMEGLLGETAPMARLRGRWHDFRGTPLMATYHPAYLLRNQSLGEKRKVWEDMLMVLEKLGKPITEKQRSFFLSK